MYQQRKIVIFHCKSRIIYISHKALKYKTNEVCVAFKGGKLKNLIKEIMSKWRNATSLQTDILNTFFI